MSAGGKFAGICSTTSRRDSRSRSNAGTGAPPEVALHPCLLVRWASVSWPRRTGTVRRSWVLGAQTGRDLAGRIGASHRKLIVFRRQPSVGASGFGLKGSQVSQPEEGSSVLPDSPPVHVAWATPPRWFGARLKPRAGPAASRRTPGLRMLRTASVLKDKSLEKAFSTVLEIMCDIHPLRGRSHKFVVKDINDVPKDTLLP